MKTKFLLTMSMAILLLSAQVQAYVKIIDYKKDKAANKKTVKTKSVRVSKDYTIEEMTQNVNFGFNKIAVRTTYYDKLDNLAKYLVDNKGSLLLRGYADAIGGFKTNWVISDKRANEVKTYLVNKGVPDDKIITTPFGSTKPIATNKTKEGRQKNRRVEVKIS